ncbi:hypothetical protein EIP86_002354 [Pleurotus ostreatoroseus]|nr:hypothetical protein EIP86_002354 [Pleurotus ostreatoroseus]
MSLPEVGKRLAYSGYTGTVRYVGHVDGTQGIWLGVEWDDSKRGKHDGVKDDRRYFSCLVPGSGSFIRPSSAVSYGTTFLKALISKYVEIPHGPGMETVVLGSSRGAIEVEAVNLDKIRGNLSKVEKLREVSLDNEQVTAVDPPGEIRKTCPELQLNATLMIWDNVRLLASYIPSLQVLETGYNQLRHLLTNKDDQSHMSELRVINFDSNELTDWTAICHALSPFTKLQRLVLSSNHISAIAPIADTSSSSVRSLKHLALASNALRSWADIDHISDWCPELESLTLTENPLVEDAEQGPHARQFIIARVPSLVVLDAAKITQKERTDCELYYLSYVSKHGPADDDAKLVDHPRWRELCESEMRSLATYAQSTDLIRPPPPVTLLLLLEYGKPHASPREVQDKQDTLGNRLVQVTVRRCRVAPDSQANTDPEVVETASLRVLPTMTAKTFRMKLAKSFKVARSQQAHIRLWLQMPDTAFAEIEATDGDRDLAWWGVEDNSLVYLVVG